MEINDISLSGLTQNILSLVGKTSKGPYSKPIMFDSIKQGMEYMSMNDSHALRTLIDHSLVIYLNASDTFCYATAYSVPLDPEDLKWALPIMDEYGSDGVNAVMSYIINKPVLKELQNENYNKAFKKLFILTPEVYSKEHI